MPDFRLRIAPLRNFCLIPPNSRTGGIQQSYEEALKIFQNALGDNHLFTTYSRDTLGSLLEARFCERALEVHLRVLGEDDSGTATSLSDLGNLLQEMGELAGARSHLEQTLEIRRLMLGNEHPCTASSLSDLGVLLQKMGNSNEARPYIEQAEGATPAALSAPTKTAQDHPRGGKKMTRFPRDGLTASIGSDRHSISSVVSWDPGFRYP